jgi:hypothetical protein
MADRTTTGMPLLSGPAPSTHSSSRADISCRRCNKEFNIVFTRARRCNHCGGSTRSVLPHFTYFYLLVGYSYCSSCSDYQALMPREGRSAGFDPVPVCAFCIENLTSTSSSSFACFGSIVTRDVISYCRRSGLLEESLFGKTQEVCRRIQYRGRWRP